MRHTLSISEDTYRRLTIFAAQEQQATGKPTSISAIVSRIVNCFLDRIEANTAEVKFEINKES